MSEPSGPDRPTDAPVMLGSLPASALRLLIMAVDYTRNPETCPPMSSDDGYTLENLSDWLRRAPALAGTPPADPLRKAASEAIAAAKGIGHAEPTEASEAVKLTAREIIDGLRTALAVAAPAAPEPGIVAIESILHRWLWVTRMTPGTRRIIAEECLAAARAVELLDR